MRRYLFLIIVSFTFVLVSYGQEKKDENQKSHDVIVIVELDDDIVKELAGMLLQGIRIGDQVEIREALSESVLVQKDELLRNLIDPNVAQEFLIYVSNKQAVYILNMIHFEKDADVEIKVVGLDEDSNEWTVEFLTDNNVFLTVTISNTTTLVTSFNIPNSQTS